MRPFQYFSAIVYFTFWAVSAMAVAPNDETVDSLGYSFFRDGSGGVAMVRIDTVTGKFLDDRVLFESPGCTRPDKLRFEAASKQYVLTSETDDKSGPHVYLIATDKGAEPRTVTLPELPDEIRVSDGFALISCDGDKLIRVDLDSAKITGEWDADKLLDPPANGPQDIRLMADRQTVIVSFQKDSRKGTKKGSRIAAFRLPDMEVVADAELPRNRPDLHIDGNDKEQGPGPEVVHINEPGNRIVVTLDLYGALAVADLDEFLSQKEVTWKYLSTAADESWGDSFPDRMTAFTHCGKPFVMVANAGTNGGVALLDLQEKAITWRCASPAGLESPIYLPSQGRVYSVCSGKRKVRGRRDIEKSYVPQRGVFVFDLAVDSADALTTNASAPSDCSTNIPTERFMFRISRVGTDEKPWVVVAGGFGNPDTLMILDPRTGDFVDERPAIGAVMQFEQQ